MILGAAMAVAAMTGAAFAGSSYELKAGDGDYSGTKSKGNAVAYYSSDATGNGAAVGGNGSSWDGDHDQTTTPGSRADIVHDALGKPRPGEK